MSIIIKKEKKWEAKNIIINLFYSLFHLFHPLPLLLFIHYYIFGTPEPCYVWTKNFVHIAMNRLYCWVFFHCTFSSKTTQNHFDVVVVVDLELLFMAINSEKLSIFFAFPCLSYLLIVHSLSLWPMGRLIMMSKVNQEGSRLSKNSCYNSS